MALHNEARQLAGFLKAIEIVEERLPFGLQALFVEPHTHRAALAAHVQGAALLREIVPVPGLAPHDSALLLDLDGWP